MGIKRKSNLIKSPRKPFDAKRIAEEKEIIKKFGLKNKKEIWKAEFQIKKIKRKAKSLITSSEEKKRIFVESLNNKGFNLKELVDALDLKTEDWLSRRLQTIVFKKGLAKTIKEARQLVTHKKILVGDRIVNVPSYFVEKSEENEVKLREKENVQGQ
ncbi:MAG: 30S ribosomal protein S4 [Candidatus Pacearchaeota archaeon]